MNAQQLGVMAGQNGATLAASAGPEGTTVTIPDTGIVAANLLRFWFVANVLREPLPNPMMTVKSEPRVLVWNDRLEAWRKRAFSRKLVDSVPMERITGVLRHKRKFTVNRADGPAIMFKAPTKDEADRAEQIIASRVTFYREPALA